MFSQFRIKIGINHPDGYVVRDKFSEITSINIKNYYPKDEFLSCNT